MATIKTYGVLDGHAYDKIIYDGYDDDYGKIIVLKKYGGREKKISEKYFDNATDFQAYEAKLLSQNYKLSCEISY